MQQKNKIKDIKEGIKIVVTINNAYSFRNISTNSGVKYILTPFCFLKYFSLDQIAQPRYKANAKYGTSLLCGANFSALDCISAENSYIGNISTLLLRILNSSITPGSESPQILAIVPVFLLNSSIKYGKATNLNLSSKNKSFVLPLPIMAANKTVASTTNSIYISSRNLFATASEILSVNSLEFLSETLILDEISLSLFNFSALSNIALTATSDQSNLNSFIVFSNSSGTDIVIVFILSPLNNKIDKDAYKFFYIENSDIFFDKIVPIKVLEPQQVYDLMIDNSHNFIANGIVAHKTYLATSSGNLGINTTSPSQTFQVAGTANIAKIKDFWDAQKSLIFDITSGSTQFLVNSNGDVTINLKG